MRAPVRGPRAAIAVGVALALLSGCAQVVPGRATVAAPQSTPTAAATAPAVAAPPLGTDALAAAATAALQDLWRQAYPAAIGREWRPVADFAPVHTDDPAAATPPCVGKAADLKDQAFYCPAADTVVWDADGLIPELEQRFGPAGVLVVLAHEVGHAVQSRLGVDDAQARDPAAYPTILLEAMADCYAGVALARLAEKPVPGLPVGAAERDDALLALVGFRDPLGVEPGDVSAHGNAFDRVSAFQDGYSGSTGGRSDGAVRCAGMTLANRTFTQRRFGSAADRARGGDLPLSQLLEAVQADARGWFTTLAAARAPGWAAPPLADAGDARACPAEDLVAQGPVRFCAADGAIAVDPVQLAPLHRQLGDYADATLIASRYGLALLAADGEPTTGPAAGAAAVCLAGAYTGRLIDPDGPFSLSPGDLDEAVQVLLADDWAARDARGGSDPAEHGFERLDRFRTGLIDGPAPCLPGG